MTKIKSVTMENFGSFQGVHKILFSTDVKKRLTVVIGDRTSLRIGPPNQFSGDGNDYETSLMVSDAIRNALGQNVTDEWKEYFPEHFYKNAKSVVELEGENLTINKENEILYFFCPNNSKNFRHITEYGGDTSVVSSPDIPKKFLTENVVKKMNDFAASRPFWGEEKLQFVLKNEQIQIHFEDDTSINENWYDKDGMVKFGDYGPFKEKYDLTLHEFWYDFFGLILFLAMRHEHLPNSNSFAVIQGGWRLFNERTLRIIFPSFLHNCEQVIFLTDSEDFWNGDTSYEPSKALCRLPQSKRAIFRAYQIDVKGENENMQTRFVISGMKTSEQYDNYRNKIGDLSRLLDTHLRKVPEMISDVAKDKEIKDLGVYTISLPNDDEIVYVGKTKTKTIPGRMHDHLMHKHLDTDSDLANMVLRRSELPQDYENYLVRYTPLEDSRMRMRFEMFAISSLNPRLNKDDNKTPKK